MAESYPAQKKKEEMENTKYRTNRLQKTQDK